MKFRARYCVIFLVMACALAASFWLRNARAATTLSQPDPSKLTVTAGGNSLTVENVGPVTGVSGLAASYIILRLPDGLPPGDLLLVVTLNGNTSTNTPTLSISP